MSIRQTRIITEDRGEKGSTMAFLTLFNNALTQKRQIAFDGQRWWVQAKMDDRTPFRIVGEDEVPQEVKDRMTAFLVERWAK